MRIISMRARSGLRQIVQRGCPGCRLIGSPALNVKGVARDSRHRENNMRKTVALNLYLWVGLWVQFAAATNVKEQRYKRPPAGGGWFRGLVHSWPARPLPPDVAGEGGTGWKRRR